MCDKIMEKINIHELVREGIRTAPALYKPLPEDAEITDEHVLMALRLSAAVSAKVNGENEILQENNEDLKAQIEALKQDMEEVQDENSNMRALIQTSLTIQNHADLQDEIEELKKKNNTLQVYADSCEEKMKMCEKKVMDDIGKFEALENHNGFLNEKVRRMELQLLGHQRLITKLQK